MKTISSKLPAENLIFGILLILFMPALSQTSDTISRVIPIIVPQPTRNIEIPKVLKEFEVMDFSKIDTSQEIQEIILRDGSHQEFQKQSYGHIIRLSPADSYFIICKQYYKNGNIKLKGVIFNSGDFKTGFGYYFSNSGQLTKEENNDTGFQFTFQDVFNYCTQQQIGLMSGHIQLYTGFHTTIEKRFEGKNSEWFIVWAKGRMLLEEITLDGNTGIVLLKKEIPWDSR